MNYYRRTIGRIIMNNNTFVQSVLARSDTWSEYCSLIGWSLGAWLCPLNLLAYRLRLTFTLLKLLGLNAIEIDNIPLKIL